DQMFQIDNRARNVPGASGPRIGADGGMGDANSTIGRAGIPIMAGISKKRIGGRNAGTEASGASGSFLISTQHESPSSVDPQAGQHLSLPVAVLPNVANPAVWRSFSNRQDLIGAATVGSIRPKQYRRRIATAFC